MSIGVIVLNARDIVKCLGLVAVFDLCYFTCFVLALVLLCFVLLVLACGNAAGSQSAAVAREQLGDT